MQSLISLWPDVDAGSALSALKTVDRSRYPELDRYSREDIYRNIQGEGGLFLAHDMAREMRLKPGMRVLDLGCGTGETSLFLARHFGVAVVALDKRLDEARLASRAEGEGLGHLVTPRRQDVRRLSPADGLFDAVFSMNAYFYFGTDDLFAPYLLNFVCDGGRICIASPCYREELSRDTPEEFLIEFPDCLAVHSPAWWRHHFEKTRGVDILRCELHPHSREFWEDFVRAKIERNEPRQMTKPEADGVLMFLKVLDMDTACFISHLFLLAEKRPGARFGASLEWYAGA
jgi:SAM-dependent methyltransferase